MEIISFQSPFIFIFIFTFLAFIYTLYYSFLNKKYTIKYPPTPFALPLIGHLHLLSPVLHKSIHNLAIRYGPFMFIRVGAVHQYVVSNANIAKEIFKTHDIKFAARPEFGSSEYQIYRDVLYSTLDYNKYYVLLKKISMREVFSTQQMNRFSGFRKEEMMEMLGVFVKKSQLGEACDISVQSISMTNNLVSRIVMSKRCSATGDEASEIRELSKGLTLLAGKLSLGDIFGPIKKFDIFGAGKQTKSLLKRYDKLMDGIIKEHDDKAKGKAAAGGERERKDMMDILLEIADDPTSEANLTRHGIKGFFLDIFFGGTDTTSVGLQWAMAELLNHPEALKKVKEEIDEVVGSRKLIEESDIQNLPYLQAAVKETLRLHPPVPLLFRLCREDCIINGYDIRKGAKFVISLYDVNRDPSMWEDADEFKPERFLASYLENNSIVHEDVEGTIVQNFSYVPFGGGRRGCPGAGLATTVIYRTLGAMIQCFDWKIKGANMIDM